jgi:hypothetical protein
MKLGATFFRITPALLLIALALAAMSQTPTPTQDQLDRKKRIQEHEATTPSKEAIERKTRTTTRLKQEGVPMVENLPVLEDSTKAKKRTTEEIVHRAIAVCLAAVKGEGLEQEVVDQLVKQYGADQFFTPEEAAFISDKAPSQKDRIKFSWRYECLWVLWWSLGYIDKLDRPETICDVPKAVSFLKGHDAAQLCKEAKLRPLTEILDEADLIYRYHWATTNARLKGQEAPAKLEGGVVQERHYVLNWLIGYMDEAWDDISTDT